MARMLGKSGKVTYRPGCPCCNLSESHEKHKQDGRQIKRQREKRAWRTELARG